MELVWPAQPSRCVGEIPHIREPYDRIAWDPFLIAQRDRLHIGRLVADYPTKGQTMTITDQQRSGAAVIRPLVAIVLTILVGLGAVGATTPVASALTGLPPICQITTANDEFISDAACRGLKATSTSVTVCLFSFANTKVGSIDARLHSNSGLWANGTHDSTVKHFSQSTTCLTWTGVVKGTTYTPQISVGDATSGHKASAYYWV